MADVLTYVLHYEGAFNKNSLGAVSEAAKRAKDIGQEAHAVVVGEDVPDDLAKSLGKYGATKVWRAKAPEGLVGQVHRAVGAERDGLVQRAERGIGAHRDRDDLVHRDRSALLDLHGGLDRVRVEGVQVLFPAAVEALGIRVHALLDGGVRDLFHQDANLQSGLLFRYGVRDITPLID